MCPLSVETLELRRDEAVPTPRSLWSGSPSRRLTRSQSGWKPQSGRFGRNRIQILHESECSRHNLTLSLGFHSVFIIFAFFPISFATIPGILLNILSFGSDGKARQFERNLSCEIKWDYVSCVFRFKCIDLPLTHIKIIKPHRSGDVDVKCLLWITTRLKLFLKWTWKKNQLWLCLGEATRWEGRPRGSRFGERSDSLRRVCSRKVQEAYQRHKRVVQVVKVNIEQIQVIRPKSTPIQVKVVKVVQVVQVVQVQYVQRVHEQIHRLLQALKQIQVRVDFLPFKVPSSQFRRNERDVAV